MVGYTQRVIDLTGPFLRDASKKWAYIISAIALRIWRLLSVHSMRCCLGIDFNDFSMFCLIGFFPLASRAILTATYSGISWQWGYKSAGAVLVATAIISLSQGRILLLRISESISILDPSWLVMLLITDEANLSDNHLLKCNLAMATWINSKIVRSI